MKYSTFVYGSAEDARGTMDKLAIHKELGLPLVAKSLLTGAKQVDAQCAHEVGVYTMMAALAGCRTFRCAGLLSSAELYSAEKLVVDHEIVQYIRKTLEPEEFSEETLLADEIAAVKPGESFLEHPSTFKFYKSHYWDPALFTHSNLGQWQEMGSKSLYRCGQRAGQEAAEGAHLRDRAGEEAGAGPDFRAGPKGRRAGPQPGGESMKLADYGLKGGLNPEQLRTMHEKAMWLIETSGIQVPHEGVRRLHRRARRGERRRGHGALQARGRAARP